MTQLTITIPRLVLIALSLDDHCMQAELGVQVKHIGISKLYQVVGDAEHLSTIVDDIISRSQPERRDGWDQPANWRAACKRTAPRIAKQLQEQGHQIVQHGLRHYISQEGK